MSNLAPTPAQIAAQVIADGDTAARQLFSVWRRNFLSVWASGNPQAVFSAWGTGAAQQVQNSTAVIAALETYNPGSTVSTVAVAAGFNIVLNPDGTVSVTAKT